MKLIEKKNVTRYAPANALFSGVSRFFIKKNKKQKCHKIAFFVNFLKIVKKTFFTFKNCHKN